MGTIPGRNFQWKRPQTEWSKLLHVSFSWGNCLITWLQPQTKVDFAWYVSSKRHIHQSKAFCYKEWQIKLSGYWIVNHSVSYKIIIIIISVLQTPFLSYWITHNIDICHEPNVYINGFLLFAYSNLKWPLISSYNLLQPFYLWAGIWNMYAQCPPQIKWQCATLCFA